MITVTGNISRVVVFDVSLDVRVCVPNAWPSTYIDRKKVSFEETIPLLWLFFILDQLLGLTVIVVNCWKMFEVGMGL